MKLSRIILFIISAIVFMKGANYFINATTIMQQNFGMNHFILSAILFVGYLVSDKDLK